MEIRAAKQQGSLLATHTPGLHGESHRVVAKDFDPSRDAKNDFALIPLDERITGITPLRLPTSDCPDPLEGAFYGFGEGDFFTTYIPPARDAYVKRVGHETYDSSDGTWVKRFNVVATSFVGQIPLLGDLIAATSNSGNLQLVQPGDSGGPLIEDGTSTACGVCSMLDFSPVSCEFNPFSLLDCSARVVNTYADISRSDARTWVNDRVTDSAGRLKGTCNVATGGRASLNTVDSDGDTIPDACDPCPNTADKDYDLSTTPDADADGIPDRCDLCPGFADTLSERTVATPSGDPPAIFPQPDRDSDGIGDRCDLCSTEATPTPPATGGRQPAEVNRNCNLETELQLHYAGLGLSGPPKVFFDSTRNAFGESYADAANRWQAAFKDDACDPAPCPELELSDSVDLNGTSVVGELPVTRLSAPNALNCIARPGQTCSVSLKSVIAHRPKPSGLTAGRSSTIHTKWCDCEISLDPQFRQQCADRATRPCVGLPAFRGRPQWREISTQVIGVTGFRSQALSSYTLTASASPAQVEQWDFTALGAPFVLGSGGTPLTNLAPPLSPDAHVRGVLWNSTLTVAGIAESGTNSVTATDIRERGSALTQGDAGYLSHVNGEPTIFAPIQPFPNYGCLSCPFSRGNIYIGRPPWDMFGLRPFDQIRIEPAGWVVKRPLNVDAFSESLAGFLSTPGNTLVQASDLVEVIGARFNGFGGATRAVGLSANADVLTAVRATSLQAPLSLDQVTPSARPTLFAAALSRPMEAETLGSTELIARRLSRPARPVAARRSFGLPRAITILEEAIVVQGSPGTHQVTLELETAERCGKMTCRYRRDRHRPSPVGDQTRADAYRFGGCTDGARPGDAVLVRARS